MAATTGFRYVEAVAAGRLAFFATYEGMPDDPGWGNYPAWYGFRPGAGRGGIVVRYWITRPEGGGPATITSYMFNSGDHALAEAVNVVAATRDDGDLAALVAEFERRVHAAIQAHADALHAGGRWRVVVARGS